MAGDGELTVVFDGWCRVCARTIAMLERLDRHDRLKMVPCQSIEGVERFGLTRAQCDASVCVIDAAGEAIDGGAAAMLILATALEQQWLKTLGNLPVLRHLIDTGYRFVSKHRRRLPGSRPWCAEHPGLCVDDEPAL